MAGTTTLLMGWKPAPAGFPVIRERCLGETRAEAFLPYWQFPEPGISVVLAAANPAGLAPPLRQAVAAIDRQLPVVDVRTLTEMLGTSISQPRFLATLEHTLKELVSDSLVYRYNPSASPDGLAGDEDRPTLCGIALV